MRHSTSSVQALMFVFFITECAVASTVNQQIKSSLLQSSAQQPRPRGYSTHLRNNMDQLPVAERPRRKLNPGSKEIGPHFGLSRPVKFFDSKGQSDGSLTPGCDTGHSMSKSPKCVSLPTNNDPTNGDTSNGVDGQVSTVTDNYSDGQSNTTTDTYVATVAPSFRLDVIAPTPAVMQTATVPSPSPILYPGQKTYASAGTATLPSSRPVLNPEQFSTSEKCDAVAFETLVSNAPSQTYSIQLGLVMDVQASVESLLIDLRDELQIKVAPLLTNCATTGNLERVRKLHQKNLRKTQQSNEVENIVFGQIEPVGVTKCINVASTSQQDEKTVCTTDIGEVTAYSKSNNYINLDQNIKENIEAFSSNNVTGLVGIAFVSVNLVDQGNGVESKEQGQIEGSVANESESQQAEKSSLNAGASIGIALLALAGFILIVGIFVGIWRCQKQRKADDEYITAHRELKQEESSVDLNTLTFDGVSDIQPCASMEIDNEESNLPAYSKETIESAIPLSSVESTTAKHRRNTITADPIIEPRHPDYCGCASCDNLTFCGLQLMLPDCPPWDSPKRERKTVEDTVDI